MTIEAYLERRLLVREPAGVLDPEDIRTLFGDYKLLDDVNLDDVNLVVVSSSEAHCDSVFIPRDGSRHVIFDLQSLRFALDMFVAASHTVVGARATIIKSGMTSLALLKSLNYSNPSVTLELLMRDCDQAFLAHEGGGIDRSIPHVKDWTLCQAAASLYLISHEITHLDRKLFGEFPALHSMLSDALRDDAQLMDDGYANFRQYTERLADILDKHPTDRNIVSEEMTCDFFGIVAGMDLIFEAEYSVESRRSAVACMVTAIVANWISRILDLHLTFALEGQDYSYNEEIDAALLARCHCMAHYAIEEWLFRTDDAKEEQQFAAKVADDIEILIGSVGEVLRDLFGNGADKAWRRAFALVGIGIVDAKRMETFVLENA